MRTSCPVCTNAQKFYPVQTSQPHLKHQCFLFWHETYFKLHLTHTCSHANWFFSLWGTWRSHKNRWKQTKKWQKLTKWKHTALHNVNPQDSDSDHWSCISRRQVYATNIVTHLDEPCILYTETAASLRLSTENTTKTNPYHRRWRSRWQAQPIYRPKYRYLLVPRAAQHSLLPEF